MPVKAWIRHWVRIQGAKAKAGEGGEMQIVTDSGTDRA